jgi:3-phosphoshikimate 1-carboxyvinyltransferase
MDLNMSTLTIKIRPTQKFKGRPLIPGDKSISHRGLIFGALAEGRTEVIDILESEDVQSTARCLQQLGVRISKSGNRTFVDGVGLYGFKASRETLDCGNSGTTIRLLMGVLSGQSFETRMTGDDSLVRRPMKRVADPLRKMGAQFVLSNEDYAPLTVKGTQLQGVTYELKVASAQIKTAITLAGLLAKGTTTITGEIHSRDHTERLLKHFGVSLDVRPDAVSITGGQKMKAATVQVPGDPSTAAFWMAAASLIPGSEVELHNIVLNPTRIGFLRALERMGANVQTQVTSENPEPIGTIRVTGMSAGKLRGIKISKEEVPTLIDELPMLAVLATQAQGVTEVEGAEELRVKETDRIEAVAVNLRAMGAQIEVRPDGYRIEGPQKLHGAQINSFHDHRIAMAFSIAGLIAQGETEIQHPECVGISYPAFFDTLKDLTTG